MSWDALATYNAERARGIAHTPDWEALMAGEQERFERAVALAYSHPQVPQMPPWPAVVPRVGLYTKPEKWAKWRKAPRP